MAKLYKWTKTGTKLLYKIRHHKGHGIHSPFVFNLINNVIEEKRPYYFYKDILQYLASTSDNKIKVSKYNLLCFRLVNYFKARTILEIGSSIGVNTLCLTAPSKTTRCICIEQDEKKRIAANKLYVGYGKNITLLPSLTELSHSNMYDCICIDLNNYKTLTLDDLSTLLELCHNTSFIIVKGIRSTKSQANLWRILSKTEKRTAKLDLFNIGILFFNKSLSRWDYQISL